MNENQLKKFTEDLLTDFRKYLTEHSPLLDEIKAQDAEVFSFVVSTSDLDRQGDSLDQSKWDFKNFLANPVILWAHDYYSPPIGICTEIKTEGDKTVATIKFAPAEANPFAAQIAALTKLGFLNATSVGYIDRGDTYELLEISVVPVPANAYALSMRDAKRLNLDLPMLATKGLKLEVKQETENEPAPADNPPAEPPKEEPATPEEPKTEDPPADPAPPAEKGAVADQLTENEIRERKYQRLNRAYDVFYAFCAAYMDEATPVDDFEKLLDEAVELMKDLGGEAKGVIAKHFKEKVGRTISAKTKAQLEAVCKALDELRDGHGNSINNAIAALKELLGSEETDEGEERQPEKGAAPKPKVEASRTGDQPDFESDMLARKVLRAVHTATRDGLEELRKHFKEKHSARR